MSHEVRRPRLVGRHGGHGHDGRWLSLAGRPNAVGRPACREQQRSGDPYRQRDPRLCSHRCPRDYAASHAIAVQPSTTLEASRANRYEEPRQSLRCPLAR